MNYTSRLLASSALLAFTLPVHAAKHCEELKAEITEKLEAKQVVGFSLEILPVAADVGDGKVVGSCEAGSKKIVYRRK